MTGSTKQNTPRRSWDVNFESGRKLSLEELKQLNRSQSQVPPKPPAEPTRQDRENLLAVLTALYRLESTNSGRLERLEASVAAQEALLRGLGRQVGQLPTQAHLEALARDVAQMRAELKRAGKKKEFSVSLPSLETALSVLIWLALILLGTLVGMVVLRTIWSGLAALWSAVRMLIP
jgi:uncharacterized coiled-coil protein SlyX